MPSDVAAELAGRATGGSERAGGASILGLLARFREFSAEGVLNLSRLPALIAEELQVEVCSIYLYGPSGYLELRATVGLSESAVGVTRFRPGEGIVGHVGATGVMVNLRDVTTHPAYSFRAETGEGRFASMLAMPVRRAEHTLGVVTLQATVRRVFAADEVEALATASMLMAEILSARGATDRERTIPRPARSFQGVTLSPGVLRGRIVLPSGARKPKRLIAEDPAIELARLERAIRRLGENFDRLLETGQSFGDGDDGRAAREVIEATRLLSTGSGWLRRVRTALEGGLSAEAAVHRVAGDLRLRIRTLADPQARERLADFEDSASGLLHALDEDRAAEYEKLPPDSLLLVRRLGPAKLLHWQARGIAGLIVEEASPAGHAAILARSTGIPAIGGAHGAIEAAEDGIEAILDADEGRLVLRPESTVARHYARLLSRREAQEADAAQVRDAPSVTADGVPFELSLNAGLPQEVARIEATGAAGVGLFRTEIFVLARGDLPTEAEQLAFYARVFEAARGRRLVFRTLDLGGDKLLPEADPPEEENPAMGWRSLRVGLDNPASFRRQLRALLLAADGRPLEVMFPMVATIAEFVAARAHLEVEASELGSASPLSIGAMLEVPSMLFALDELFAVADFVSIGSNDLMQFLFAADRGTPVLASRYPLLSEPSLRMIQSVVTSARKAGKPLSVCGEIASRPLEAATLLALGVDRLSMSPSGVLRVKETLRRIDLGAFAGRLDALRRAGASASDLSAALAEFAPPREDA